MIVYMHLFWPMSFMFNVWQNIINPETYTEHFLAGENERMQRKSYLSLLIPSSCSVYRPDEIETDVVTNDQVQLGNWKSYCIRERRLCLSVWGCRAERLSPQPACLVWLLPRHLMIPYCKRRETVFISLLWVHIMNRWKASRWQFYGSKHGALWKPRRTMVYFSIEVNGCIPEQSYSKCAQCWSVDPGRGPNCFETRI